jgi:hypothetical protein
MVSVVALLTDQERVVLAPLVMALLPLAAVKLEIVGEVAFVTESGTPPQPEAIASNTAAATKVAAMQRR